MPRLTNTRHERFAQAKAAGMSNVDAYLEAGFKASGPSARANSSKLNAKANIRERVKVLQDAAARRAEVTAAETLREIAALALSDIRKLFDEEGRLLPVTKLPTDIAKAIASVKVTTRRTSGGGTADVVYITEIKLWDKNMALEKLARHLRIYEPQGNQEDTASALVQALMASARALPVGQDTDS